MLMSANFLGSEPRQIVLQDDHAGNEGRQALQDVLSAHVQQLLAVYRHLRTRKRVLVLRYIARHQLCHRAIAYRRNGDTGFFLVGLHLIIAIDVGHISAVDAFHADDGTNQGLAVLVGHLTVNAGLALRRLFSGQLQRIALHAVGQRQLVAQRQEQTRQRLLAHIEGDSPEGFHVVIIIRNGQSCLSGDFHCKLFNGGIAQRKGYFRLVLPLGMQRKRQRTIAQNVQKENNPNALNELNLLHLSLNYGDFY